MIFFCMKNDLLKFRVQLFLYKLSSSISLKHIESISIVHHYCLYFLLSACSTLLSGHCSLCGREDKMSKRKADFEAKES
jgi:hypothetical protein